MIDFNTFALDNGLRVVHSYDPQTAMVILNVLYDTGSRDEAPELTGIAHLFEHLMFGGSVNIPSFDRALEMAGGTNNAATSNDFTYFYDMVPAQNAETPFYLESDRMLALDFSEAPLQVQRHVVIEEFKQTCLNRPYGRTSHHLLSMLYSSHPYRWPVIGITPEHIEKVTLEDVKRWFYSHYAPNNAILSIVGNITLERAKELTEKWFGGIPAQPIAARSLPQDPWLTEEKRQVVYENVPQTLITMGYRMPAYGQRGYFATDAITDILAAGKSARLYQRLVLGSALFTSADASISGFEDSGVLLANARITRDDDASVEQAINMLKEQFVQLAEPGNVTDYELLRSKNRYEATFTIENMQMVKKALTLATAVYHGEDINDNVPRYRSLTCDDIVEAASDIFIEHAPAILITKPAPQP